MLCPGGVFPVCSTADHDTDTGEDSQEEPAAGQYTHISNISTVKLLLKIVLTSSSLTSACFQQGESSFRHILRIEYCEKLSRNFVDTFTINVWWQVSSLHKNWDNRLDGKQKMIRMSVRKLRRLGDVESALHRAVLLNNTLEVARATAATATATATQQTQSQYSREEERVLAEVRLQPPLSHAPSPAPPPPPPHPLRGDTEPEPELCSESRWATPTQQQPPPSHNEYLLEDDRTIFNTYLSLCSSELLYESKSIAAA